MKIFKITFLTSLLLSGNLYAQPHKEKAEYKYILIENTDIWTDSLIVNHVTLKSGNGHALRNISFELFNFIFRNKPDYRSESIISLTCYPSEKDLIPHWEKIKFDTIPKSLLWNKDTLRNIMYNCNIKELCDEKKERKIICNKLENPYYNKVHYGIIFKKNNEYYLYKDAFEVKILTVFLPNFPGVYAQNGTIGICSKYYIDLDEPLTTYADYYSFEKKYGNWQTTLWRGQQGRDKIFHSYDEVKDTVKYYHFWKFGGRGEEEVYLNGFSYVQGIGITGGSYDNYAWYMEDLVIKETRADKPEYFYNFSTLKSYYRIGLRTSEIIYTVDKVNGLSPKEY